MISNNLRGAFFALAGFGAFSLHDAVVKALGGYYAPVQIVFFSALFGFPLVALVLIGQGSGGLRPVHPWWNALRTLALMVVMLSAFYAFATIPFAQAYALIFATPLIITALSVPMLGERVGPRRWAAVVLGLLGVLIVLRPWGEAHLAPGHLAALFSAFAGALVALIMRKIGNAERSAVFLLYPMLANVVVMGAVLPLVYEPMPILHLGGMALVALGSVTAMGLIILAYRAGEAVVVAPMQYSQMLWAIGLGYLVFGERVDGATLAGSAVIALSGLGILWREGQLPPSSARPALHGRARPDPAPSNGPE
ncbi:EamA domain-containing membrane protein RarD [Rhodovulum bhavnagarense]|uniref:EamA domain-containing membrane protein RarD n=1 Tax=Rhodovulum bhavnagarense TaxID=992286 RepID=A0A4R2RJQ8_9RHOB|nr:DMT family transporter [Rhodovulum bhavnagarense]TCP59911.1 EamA domain-containing membrane protein RarD [Rhodovulum bhavnagarense]